jgi:hypothetical protein
MEWTCTIRQRVKEQVSCISAQEFLVSDGTRFINWHNKPLINSYFPESAIEELDTGHWSKSTHFAHLQLLTLCIVHAEM